MDCKIFVIIAFLVLISFTVSGQTKKDFAENKNYPGLNSISNNFYLTGISNNSFKKGFNRNFLFSNDSVKHAVDSSVNRLKIRSQKPELDYSRLPLQFIVGNGLGVASGIIGVLLVGTLSGDLSAISRSGTTDLSIAMLLGLTIFHTAGSIAGVYLTGGNNEIEYNLGWTIIGGLIGTGVELLCWHLESKSNNETSDVLYILPLSLPTIGSMVGFNASMEYKNPGSKINSLLNFESGKMKVKLPTVKLKRLSCIGNSQNTSNLSHFYFTTLSLLSYNF